MTEQDIALAFTGTGLSSLVLLQVAQRRRRQRRDERALAFNVERGAHLPASLHPVIDAEVCIGSLSCLKACPEGDILGIIDGAARLVHATNCIGHGRCAAACPVNAIKLVFGSATRGVDLPEVDGRFESSRPGVHVIGELAGMGLIGNAIEQGVQCAGYLADDLARVPGTGGSSPDVVVVGAGPAGVACALELRARGLSVRLLDQERLGGAIARYPRQKLVTDRPVALPGASALRRTALGKDDLLAYFSRGLARAGQPVEEGVKVTGLVGQDGAFTVVTERGTVTARKVVLATGRRGSPRRLGVPGELLGKVTSELIDADQYQGARVLVVGGGDTAVEAACALAERGGVEVTFASRGQALTRCGQTNRARALELAGQGKLVVMLATEVQLIEAGRVQLRSEAGTISLRNDYVIACLGGELPREFLQRVGVQVRRLFGEEPGPARGGARTAAPPLPAGLAIGRPWRRWLVGAGGLVLGLVASLAWLGWTYYALPSRERLGSPLHTLLKPAGTLGLTIGIAASAVMFTNFLYALRKRWSLLAGVGSLSGWLEVHVFVGITSPMIIAFHAAFQSNNLMASATYAALGVVVSTGLVGRYFYGLIPGAAGTAVELADLLGQQERLKARARPQLAGASDPAWLEALFEEASAAPPAAPLLIQLGRSIPDTARFRVRLARGLRLLPADQRGPLREALLRLHRLRTQASVFGGIKRLMRSWRSLHAALAVLLVVALAAHIGIAVYLGYGPRWP
jgi:thioredoxin reductase/NAD-dependent dihydropyrimidine dehydrogenase PreA subunit